MEGQDFQSWLRQNRYGTYNGVEITPTTQLVSYTYVISAIVITYRKSTRYYFMDVEKKQAATAKLLCTLCNLLFGWWGFPWGPIWTVKETFCNLIDSDTKCWGAIAGSPNNTEE